MIGFHMIDTATLGIRRAYNIQKAKYFPMPDYDFSSGVQVDVTVYGKTLDDNYMHILYDHPELNLQDAFLLDKVQKGIQIEKKDADRLRALKLVEGRLGKLLHFKKEDVSHAVEWFDSKGNYTVFFCRFIPIVRSLISIPAGMAHMHFSKFFILTTFGSLIWNTVLVTLGAFAGASWQKTAQYFHSYSQAGKLVLCAFTLIGIFFYIKKRFQK